jgi:hypothetical protein
MKMACSNAWRVVALACALLGGPSLAAAQTPLPFGTFSAEVVRGGVEYSDSLQELAGRRVVLEGFMAPPLKPRIDWFVLTREPMLTCPFCSEAAEWPPDIVMVLLPPGRTINTESNATRIRVTGVLDIGVAQDVEAGLSLIRVRDARVERVR